jgi:hypothetical protein
MTDHPRFKSIRSAPDRAHDSYHGGRLVSSVLRLVDWWRATRESKRAVCAAPSILSTRGCEDTAGHICRCTFATTCSRMRTDCFCAQDTPPSEDSGYQLSGSFARTV